MKSGKSIRTTDGDIWNPIERYCTVTGTRDKTHHPHPVPKSSHCFAHEYDDESVLLPKNPKWGGHDLWPYEEERAEKLRVKGNHYPGELPGQMTLEELL